MDSLILRNPFKVYEPLGIKERNNHDLLWQPTHLCLLGPGGVCVLQLGTLTFVLRVVG